MSKNLSLKDNFLLELSSASFCEQLMANTKPPITQRLHSEHQSSVNITLYSLGGLQPNSVYALT